MASRASEPPEETVEKWEARVEEEVILRITSFSSSPDEAIMPPPPSLAHDFHLFQNLAKIVADTLQIPLEVVKDPHHKLLDT